MRNLYVWYIRYKDTNITWHWEKSTFVVLRNKSDAVEDVVMHWKATARNSSSILALQGRRIEGLGTTSPPLTNTNRAWHIYVFNYFVHEYIHYQNLGGLKPPSSPLRLYSPTKHGFFSARGIYWSLSAFFTIARVLSTGGKGKASPQTVLLPPSFDFYAFQNHTPTSPYHFST